MWEKVAQVGAVLSVQHRALVLENNCCGSKPSSESGAGLPGFKSPLINSTTLGETSNLSVPQSFICDKVVLM